MKLNQLRGTFQNTLKRLFPVNHSYFQKDGNQITSYPTAPNTGNMGITTSGGEGTTIAMSNRPGTPARIAKFMGMKQ
jgi:hypothetical protein